MMGAANFAVNRELTKRSVHMERIQKNFGFGFMRLPMEGERVDFDAL